MPYDDNDYGFEEEMIDGFNGPTEKKIKASEIEDYEIKALDRKLNSNTSRYFKKKEAAIQAVDYFLKPFLSNGSYQSYNLERKRLKALEERKSYLLRTLPEKLGLTGAETIYIENAIDSFLSPPTRGEEWTCDESLEDMQFDWICRDLGLAPGDSIVVTAEPFAGKTYLASHIALAVMSGKPIFGKFLMQKKGKVAHLNYDAADSKMVKIGYRRLANGIDFTWKKGDFYYESPLWKFNHESAYENLKEICTGRAFCIVDSLRACFDGEENSSEIVNVVALANRVSEETGCAIFFIAHTGKGGVGNKGLDATRGSSAVAAAVGTAWNLEKGEDKTLKLSCVKGRLGQFSPIVYQYAETGEFLENINKTSKVEMSFVGGEQPKQTIRDQIKEALANGVKINKTELKEKITGRDVSINDELDKLEAEKLITVEPNPKNKREKIISLTETDAWS